MSDAETTNVATRRGPRVFDLDDPSVTLEPVLPQAVEPPPRGRKTGDEPAAPRPEAPIPASGVAARAAGFGWVTTLVSALAALAGLAATLSFTHFVSIALSRTDWIGGVAWGLLALAGIAALVLALREIVGLMRLSRMARLRRDAEAALRGGTRGDGKGGGDPRAERLVVRRLRSMLSGRPELAWALARFREHEGDVRDAGELMALADRELLAPLDLTARRLILASAKRVSMVTALSPVALLAVGFVLVENLALLRRLAALYGGRPGLIGSLRLARMVFVHLIATGGVALTDDILGQFIGQDLVRRLSRRLGEGVFNGALTARIGTVALDVCRPLPFIEASPVRIRDVLAEFMRRDKEAGKG